MTTTHRITWDEIKDLAAATSHDDRLSYVVRSNGDLRVEAMDADRRGGYARSERTHALYRFEVSGRMVQRDGWSVRVRCLWCVDTGDMAGTLEFVPTDDDGTRIMGGVVNRRLVRL